MHLFGLGGDGQVYEQNLDANGNPLSFPLSLWWSTDTSTRLTSNVTLTSDANGNMHLFATGVGRAAWELDLNASDLPTKGWFDTLGFYDRSYLVSDLSAGGGGAVSSGVSVLGSLNCEPAAGLLYSPASGTLFGPGGPSYLDVQQGGSATAG
jgi:hypothetical protein